MNLGTGQRFTPGVAQSGLTGVMAPSSTVTGSRIPGASGVAPNMNNSMTVPGMNALQQSVVQNDAPVSHEIVYKWIEDLGCSDTRENSLLELRLDSLRPIIGWQV